MAPNLKEAVEILAEHGIDLSQVLKDTHAETMLRVGTLLDGMLEIVIKGRMLKNGEAVKERMFQKHGNLQTLGAKIKKAQNLKILDEVAFKDADLLREIRNEFAHLKTKVNFDSPEISKWAKQLSTFDGVKSNREAIFAAMEKVVDCLQAASKDNLSTVADNTPTKSGG
jgi:DNA-binding MltR family transcriptional regulator